MVAPMVDAVKRATTRDACEVAATYLAGERPNIESVVEGFFETQYEQKVRQLVAGFGSAFSQCKTTMPVIYAETDENILFFANEQRFMQWAWKRFKYEDQPHAMIALCWPISVPE